MAIGTDRVTDRPAGQAGRHGLSRAFWTALLLFTFLATSLATPPAHAGKAHEHGVGRLNLVQEGTHWSAEWELPLDTVVGFERPPRTPTERQSAQAALQTLRQPNGLIRLEGASSSACTATTSEVLAPVLEGQAAPPGGHADARVTISLQCGDGVEPQRVVLPVFKALVRLKRVEAQVVSAAGQRRYTFTPGRREVDLRR